MRRLGSVAGWLLVAAVPAAPPAAEPLSATTPRGAFFRGEEAAVTVAAPDGVRLERITIGVANHQLAEAAATASPATVMVPTERLSAGRHELSVRAETDGGHREAQLQLIVCRPVDPHRLEIWQWTNGFAWDFALDHGFTSAGGPSVRYFKPGQTADIRRRFDTLLERGGTAMGWFCGGIQRSELAGLDPETPDIAYLGAGRHPERFYNPFHPLVEAMRSEINHAMLTACGDHPALRWAFVNTEIVDDLWLDNQNEAGARLLQEKLGFTRDDRGPPKFVAPGILADDDRGYRFHKFVFQRGNGIAHANAAAARELRSIRPSLRVLTDPYRQVAYTDMFPDLDVVSTWTYTSSDPKLMLFVETLRAAVRDAGQEPLQTITLLNYPGIIAPKAAPGIETPDKATSGWMLMGPDRLKECSWIVLSRAPKTIGYYYSSACDPVKFSKPEDQIRVPRATSLAIKELSEKVYRPLGPLVTRLAVAPRDGAVLSSQASRLYGKSPRLVPAYDNDQIYAFYSVLAMTHRQADVLFDEHVERGDLDRYKYLVMPKCDVITETMHARIREFIARGGLVVADQYLGVSIPEAVKVDFDFTYRPKVNAEAIASGVMYAEWHDQLQPDTAALAKAKGVTAEEDQKLLDAFAAQLDKTLDVAWPAATRVDSPHVLVNELERDGVRYLVLVNDHRGYDDRTGPYKAIMEALRTIRVTVSVAGDGPMEPHDLVKGMALPSRRNAGRTEFEVELDALGGTLVALYPARVDRITIAKAAPIRRGEKANLEIAVVDSQGQPVRGLQPVQLTVSDPDGRQMDSSGPHVAEDGRLKVAVAPGLTDAAGDWPVEVVEHASGRTAQVILPVK